jgi:hypothetical protein
VPAGAYSLTLASASLEPSLAISLTGDSSAILFGDKVAWLSRESCAYNTSHSYGARNPTAIIVPRFVQVNDLEISHSNPSY